MKSLIVRGLAAAICVAACGSRADAIIITYLIEFDQSGQDVLVGSTVNWTLSAQVTEANVALGDGNFGIRQSASSLLNSTGEVMTAGTVGAPFTDYFAIPGVPGAPGELNEIGASLLFYNAGAVEAVGPGDAMNEFAPLVLATGSYQVNTLGLHTLTTVMPGSASHYFTDNAGTFVVYNSAVYGDSDFVNVIVPEPTSMLLGSTLLCPGLIAVRRRRKQRLARQAA